MKPTPCGRKAVLSNAPDAAVLNRSNILLSHLRLAIAAVLFLCGIGMAGFAGGASLANTIKISRSQDPSPTLAVTIFVDSTGDGNNDPRAGFCDDGAGHCTLRAAIQAANGNPGVDTIIFAISSAQPNCDATTGQCVINLTQALPDISQGVVITGPGASLLTVRRDTGGDYRIFNVTTTGTVTFSGLTISGGVENDPGGGISNSGSGTVNVTNCNVSDNYGFWGGGIANFSFGTVHVTGSTINNNNSAFGGGIYNSSGTMQVIASTINGNTAESQGGGIFNDQGTLSVDQGTLSNNVASGTSNDAGGGGIYNGAGTVQVTGSTINNNNSANDAGGIYNNSGTINVTDSTINNNPAVEIGGGILHKSGTLNVINCTISNNAAFLGGGIANFNGTVNVTVNVSNSTISENSATSAGGGILNGGATVRITNSTLSHNSATNGGGIRNFSGEVDITNSTISGNSALNEAGAIWNDASLFLSNSTVSANSAATQSGGITSLGNATVKSSIIAGNHGGLAGPDGIGVFSSQGFNLIGNNQFITGFTAPTDLVGTSVSPLDPKLDPNGLQDNGGPTKTIALLCDSPAIDQGTSAGLTGNLTTDQRSAGFLRTVDDSVIPNAAGGDNTDIGAFEAQLCGGATPTPTPTGTPMPDDTVTTVVRDQVNNDITNQTVLPGTIVHDEATVTRTPTTPPGLPDPTGTVDFKRYDNGLCSDLPASIETVALQASGIATSANFTVSAGMLSYLAHYNGDANYPAHDGTCEELSVAQPTPSPTPDDIVTTRVLDEVNNDITNQVVLPGTVVHDEATVTRTPTTPPGVPDPTGNVDFRRYDNGICSDLPASTETVALQAGGIAISSNFTVSAGAFSYLAHYSGDANYPGHDGPCEAVYTVQPTPTPTPTPSPAPGSCALSPGYWMNHPEAWCMETVMIGCATYTQAEAIAIMRHSASHDKTYSLGQQLIAAKLNGACQQSNSSCIASAIAAADNFLCAHPVGSGVTANSPGWQQIKATYDLIVKYNAGKLCAPSCRIP